ncbi:MAG: hypothetical protein ACKVZH_29130 [Blastocatellia bacterium]
MDADKLARLRRKVRQREAAFWAGEIDEEELARSVASLVAHAGHADTLAGRRKFLTVQPDSSGFLEGQLGQPIYGW